MWIIDLKNYIWFNYTESKGTVCTAHIKIDVCTYTHTKHKCEVKIYGLVY